MVSTLADQFDSAAHLVVQACRNRGRQRQSGRGRYTPLSVAWRPRWRG